MPVDQYEEHLAHSAPCGSRWDGYDRGDADNSYEDEQNAYAQADYDDMMREGLL